MRRWIYGLLRSSAILLVLDGALPPRKYTPKHKEEKTESFSWQGDRPTGRQVFSYLAVDGHALLVGEVDELYDAQSLTLSVTRVLSQVKQYETEKIAATYTRNFLITWLLLGLSSLAFVAYYELTKASYALLEIAGYSFYGILIYLVFFL